MTGRTKRKPRATKTVQEPTKLWQLVEATLGHFERAEKDKRYRIDTLQWHTGTGWITKTCSVGFAGSYIAYALKVDDTKYATAFDFEEPIRSTLEALNVIDVGYVRDAVRYFYGEDSGIDFKAVPLRVTVPYYWKGADEYKDGIRRALTVLKSMNL